MFGAYKPMRKNFTRSEVKLGNQIIVRLFMFASLIDWILFLRKGR